MSASVEVTTRGLEGLLAYFERLPEIAEQASILAVNGGARFAHAEGSRRMRDQVAWKAGYLGSAAAGGNDRFGIVKFARGGDAEAVLRGRERPTSLASFVQGSKTPGRKRPTVRVSARGGAVRMSGAWLVRLRAGKNLDDENFNVGLAVRLKPGQKLNKKVFAQPALGGAYLLYGPSVAQVFRDVARDLQAPVSARVESEFVRQFERLK